MRVDQFDFDLPDERIALRPMEPRDSARMLVVHPPDTFQNAIVRDLPSLLRPGDALVLNDTRVIAAALEGVRDRTGTPAKVTFNLIKRIDGTRWRAFARPAKRLAAGDIVRFGGGALQARVSARLDGGEVELTVRRHGGGFGRSAVDRRLDATAALHRAQAPNGRL